MPSELILLLSKKKKEKSEIQRFMYKDGSRNFYKSEKLEQSKWVKGNV